MQKDRRLLNRTQYLKEKQILKTRFEESKGRDTSITHADIMKAKFRLMMTNEMHFQDNDQDQEEVMVIAAAVQYMFSQMNLDGMYDCQEDLEKCHALTRTYMGTLNDVFEFFSGTFAGGEANLMNQAEFNSFMNAVYPHTETSIISAAIFDQVRGHHSSRQTNKFELNKAQFLECLLRFASCYFEGNEEAMILSSAFEKLLTEVLQQFQNRLSGEIAAAMADQSVQELLTTNGEPLMLVYKYYACCGGRAWSTAKEAGTDRPTMNFDGNDDICMQACMVTVLF